MNYRDAFDGRKKLNATADQIEWATSRRGDNDGAGGIHTLFSTSPDAIYKRARLNRLIRGRPDLPEIAQDEKLQGRKSRFPREANEYPAIVERRAPLNLEMMIRLCYMVLAGRGLPSGADVSVDNHFAKREWGAGGITRLRCLLWMIRYPRIDMAAKDEQERRVVAQNAILLAPEVDEVPSVYFMYFATGTHPSKPKSGDENKAGEPRKSKKEAETKIDPSSTARVDIGRFLECDNPDSEEALGERFQMVGDLADLSHMRGWREPFPGCVPSRGQSCAKFV